MFLPTTYVAALLLTLLSMFCWGSWANTQKLTGKWRFELYYFDYAFGVLLCAILAEVPAVEKHTHGQHRSSSRSSSTFSRSSSAPGPTKGIVISLISGVLMGSFYPLVQIARSGEDGVQPYADALLFAAGVFCSTFL